MRSADPFRIVHVYALALCLVFLPWSTALLSMAQILLVINWITEGFVRKDQKRWSRALRPAPAFFIGLFGLHVIGLLWTSDEGLQWGLDLVRILLPILVFGFVLSSSPRLDRSEYRTILLIGAWSVVACTIVCVAIEGWNSDYRDLSVFISHIRLALMLCLSIVVFLHFAPGPVWRMILHFAAAAWCIFFIDLLGSIGSFLILLVITMALLWRSGRSKPAVQKWTIRIVSILPLLIGIGWVFLQLNERYSFQRIEPVSRPQFSAGGEEYVYHEDDRQMENGEFVWSRIAWAEVERTWYLRSDKRLDSLDGKGHLLYPTLFRYLTSMKLPKDSVGIMTLSDADVGRVEAGIPSALWGTRSRLHDRFDEVMFEIDQYYMEGRVSGHSVPMRLEFWKAGVSIAARNLLYGVGTGDTQVEFDREYERMGTSLEKEWRHRAHNQYLTFLISFGIPGFLLACIGLWWPAWKLKVWQNDLFVAWLIIITIGSLTDDTIETQAGATFFALYYAFFVFAAPMKVEVNNSERIERPSFRSLDPASTMK